MEGLSISSDKERRPTTEGPPPRMERLEARDALLRGYTREEVCETLMSIFRAVDTDGSGSLSRKEFKECLVDSDIGLSRKDINIILTEADLDGDEDIGYEEFIPVCFNVLVERFKIEIVQKINHEGEVNRARYMPQVRSSSSS